MGRMDDDTLAAWYPRPDRPWLRLNAVTSVDGAGVVAGRSTALTDPADQQVLELLRAQCDVLLLGAGTVRAEGYAPPLVAPPRQRWRARRGRPAHPTLAVVSGRLALDPRHPVFAEAPTRPLVLTCAAAPADRREALAAVARVLVIGDRAVDLPAAVAALRGLGFEQVLCEGGPQVCGGLIAADLVDEVCLTVSPVLAGGAAGRITTGPEVPALRRLRLRRSWHAGDMLFLRYVRPDSG